jgi:hypothetical protein
VADAEEEGEDGEDRFFMMTTTNEQETENVGDVLACSDVTLGYPLTSHRHNCFE